MATTTSTTIPSVDDTGTFTGQDALKNTDGSITIVQASPGTVTITALPVLTAIKAAVAASDVAGTLKGLIAGITLP
jgi:hypothetical protein